jgi:hypothetical protein
MAVKCMRRATQADLLFLIEVEGDQVRHNGKKLSFFTIMGQSLMFEAIHPCSKVMTVLYISTHQTAILQL